MYGLMDWSGHNPADSRQCCIILIATSTDESQDGVKTNSHTCAILVLVRSYATCHMPYQLLSVFSFSVTLKVCVSPSLPGGANQPCNQSRSSRPRLHYVLFIKNCRRISCLVRRSFYSSYGHVISSSKGARNVRQSK